MRNGSFSTQGFRLLFSVGVGSVALCQSGQAAEARYEIAVDVPVRSGADCTSAEGGIQIHDGVTPDSLSRKRHKQDSLGIHTTIPPDFSHPIVLPSADTVRWSLFTSSPPDCWQHTDTPFCWLDNIRTAQAILAASKGILLTSVANGMASKRYFCTVVIKVDVTLSFKPRPLQKGVAASSANCPVKDISKLDNAITAICFPKPVQPPSGTWTDLLAARQPLYGDADDILAEAEQDFDTQLVRKLKAPAKH